MCGATSSWRRIFGMWTSTRRRSARGENLRKIFDPYFTTKQKGNGLVLSTSYAIIKKHEGSIFVESKLGVGATFRIYLPASRNKNARQIGPEGKIQKGEGRILVMDDVETG